MRVVSEVTLLANPRGSRAAQCHLYRQPFFLPPRGHLPSLFHSFHLRCGSVTSQCPPFPKFPTEPKMTVLLLYSFCSLISQTHLAPLVLCSHSPPSFFRSSPRTSLFTHFPLRQCPAPQILVLALLFQHFFHPFERGPNLTSPCLWVTSHL